MDEIKKAKKQFQLVDAQIEAFVSRLDAFLFQYVGGFLGPVVRNPQDKAEAARVIGSLYSALKELGLDQELRRIEVIYGSQLRYIRDTFEGLGVRQVFSDIDVRIVKNLIDFDTAAVANKIRQYTSDVGATLMRSVIAGEEPSFTQAHETLGPRLANQVKTETQTLLAGFSRAVTVGKAKELGFDLFIYLGPDDKVTRPFCERVLAKDPPIYSTDEIASMNNGQGLDVFSYGGGYNCRHDWRPISEDRARAMGWVP